MHEFVWVCVYLNTFPMRRHEETGDLSHPLQRSLPSAHSHQSLNWFLIVNLRGVCKENVWFLMLLLQRPQSLLKYFLSLRTRANWGWRQIHFFFLSCLFFSIEWCSKFESKNKDAWSFFLLNDFSFCALFSTGSCITFVAAICLSPPLAFWTPHGFVADRLQVLFLKFYTHQRCRQHSLEKESIVASWAV